MSGTGAGGHPDEADEAVDPAVTLQVGLAGLALVVQALLIDYGAGGVAVSVFWLLVGALLLHLVHRRHSQVARWLVVVPGLLGALLYATSTIGGAIPLLTGLTLVAAFGLQAIALLRPAVAEHCRSAPDV